MTQRHIEAVMMLAAALAMGIKGQFEAGFLRLELAIMLREFYREIDYNSTLYDQHFNMSDRVTDRIRIAVSGVVDKKIFES